MKKLWMFIFLFMLFSKVSALNFYEGNFIAGEYINKVEGNKTYYMTMQYIHDGNGNVVYCIEPFTKFYESYNYQLTDPYLNYDSDILRRVELLSYYGYGYKNRTDSKWYVITQYLIWKSVSNNDIYFTDKLNGRRIDKYQVEINELNNDVNNHDSNSLVKEYEVEYKDSINLNIDGYKVLSSDYEIVNNMISNVDKDGVIKVTKDSNYYGFYRSYYDSYGSQDLLLRGNVSNQVYDIKVNVRKGNIILDINVDNKDNFNVCYTIYKDNVSVDYVCTGSNLEYKSIDLKYGEYVVKQSSINEGYVIDDKEYVVNVGNGDNKLILNNYVISNVLEINKYYCYLDKCNEENNAQFEVYDLDNNKIGDIVTNEDGYGSINLVYGEYIVKQVKGIDGYGYIRDFNVTIDSINEEYKYSLSSNKIVQNEVLLPPKTGIKSNGYSVILIIIGLCIMKGLLKYER